jgi:hypothetical protein
MGHAYPPHSTQEHLDGSPPGCDEDTYDEHSGDVVSLLEENARLRRLVVTLSDLILRNVADRGDGHRVPKDHKDPQGRRRE